MLEVIEKRFEPFIKDLKTIVNMDSGTGYVPGLEAVRAFFNERFQRIGWTTANHTFNGGRVPCLEAFNRPNHDKNTQFDLLFMGHMDTVFEPGTVASRPFSRNDSHAYGPGVCDMKGGLVTMLHVAEIMNETNMADDISIAMAFNSDEEIGSRASRPWYESLARRSRCVMVFEPWRSTGERILHRKGGGNFEIICHGKSAHAGSAPEAGANAVIELAHQVLAAGELSRPDLGTSVNVTVVSGGTVDNVIPDFAKASVDVRIAEESEGRRIEDGFQALEKQVITPGVRVEVFGEINRVPMVPSERTRGLWDQIADIGKTIGLDMKLTSTGGCSDGNYTAALGIPTIDAMGIRGGFAHSEDEYVDLESIIPNLHLMCEIVKGFADGRIS